MHYTPEEMIGKKIVVVNNLKAAKLRGVESQGMLLAASNDSMLTLLTPEKDITSGSKVK
jgi:methionyl-tRNA synthetase